MALILVIDDEEYMRAIVKVMLERDGHTVLTAENGREAMRILQEHQVDMVITDIIMPEMEGIETIRLLRKDHKDIKIIAMSGGGHCMPEEHLYCASRLGAAHTLAKPFKLQELLSAVHDLL